MTYISPGKSRLSWMLVLCCALAACGGGSGGSSSEPVIPTPVAPTPTPPPPVPGPDPQPEPVPEPSPEEVTDYSLFESGPVRPLALSPDGRRLFVTNTPDNRLEIFNVEEDGLKPAGSVAVGLEPVAVAARTNNEVWVVNHLSDSVSIVRLGTGGARVTSTLLVGDEPRDIVFAGPQRQRAFITAAHRGQNHPTFSPGDLKQPGLGRADVWVFDSSNPGQALGGEPIAIVNLFADTPRALAVSADAGKVFVAGFLTGNRTTTLLNEPQVAAAKGAPRSNVETLLQPATGMIVGFDGQRWLDDSGSDWSTRVMFDLPDLDIFELDAMADQPIALRSYSGVGTVLFNAVSNPVSGALYVSNLDSRNRVRFEGPGTNSTTVRGHIAENRITTIAGGRVSATMLNPHVDFSLPEGQGVTLQAKAVSLAQPMEMAVSPDGVTLYLAAMGSNRIAAIPTAQLESDSYAPDPERQLSIPGGGPAGLVLSRDGSQLFVLSRYDNAISLVNTQTLSVTQTVTMFSPEPGFVRRGRRLLYDADLTSSNGTASCASCHIFGDLDGLAWDLGNPDAEVTPNPNEFVPLRVPTQGSFHPMKGPMTTQTLRGIADSGPMHWRGDRTGQDRAVVAGETESLEAAAFKEFNPAFVGLVGREEELPEPLMQDFTDFALALVPPPNPIRALDNSLNPAQREGRRVYMDERTTGGALTCNHCHVLDTARKHFGTAGLMTNEGPGITEDFKVPHLRNVYAKVGMFGESVPRPGQQMIHMGPQLRGFGLLHDGGIDTVSNFLASSVFAFDSDAQREQVVDFMYAFDTNLAPIVGQQVTIGAATGQASLDRLELLVQRAALTGAAAECDLVAKGVLEGQPRGALMQSNQRFKTDRAGQAGVGLDQLLELASEPGQEITFTCVPPGAGTRMAIDRDRDGILDGDEVSP